MNDATAYAGKPDDAFVDATILVVDDNPADLQLISRLLAQHYRVKVARGGEQALRLLESNGFPDLILLDIMMPEMDGYEVMRRLNDNDRCRDTPVIFLTALSASDDERTGLELGAVDYITKPINPAITLCRVRNHLRLKAARDVLAHRNTWLASEVAKRTEEAILIQDVTIHALASLAETRDNETGNHLRRTQHYVKELALHLRSHARFRDELDDAAIEALFKSAPLHDIGKVGIPDDILLKPGSLTAEEWEIMKTHTTLGRDAILQAESAFGREIAFLRYAKEIAYSHQEKWDGSGYPQGLSGEAIPVSARLMAIADVYDALISKRVYKPPFSHQEAVRIITDGRGRHFDPDVTDAFLALADRFQQIAKRYADPVEP